MYFVWVIGSMVWLLSRETQLLALDYLTLFAHQIDDISHKARDLTFGVYFGILGSLVSGGNLGEAVWGL